MAQKFLKTPTLDIHAGGRDLVFPHHENEIAQAEAATGKPFAKYWIHHGLLTINGQKMSKSLGNFITIKDFVARYKNPDLLKMFFLSAHYSHPIDYTGEKIEEARQALERIMILKARMDRGLSASDRQLSAEGSPEVASINDKFIQAMDDDFNTPEALACIFELVTLINKHIDDSAFIKSGRDLLERLLGILGISFQVRIGQKAIADEEVEIKIKERETARRKKDFALSDRIRGELEAGGVILEDTKDGTAWRRKL
jgi:cysteinyl-tRNA synthetase